MEEFEEKIDALGENEEEKPSWLGSILQGVFDEADLGEENEEGVVEGSIGGDEEDLDYVEPPFLDTRLGGGENTNALVRRRRAAGRREDAILRRILTFASFIPPGSSSIQGVAPTMITIDYH